MRFFGVGFCLLSSVKILVTYHHFYSGKLRELSYKTTLKRNNLAGVIHTENYQKSLEEYGISNTFLCQYPAFEYEEISNIEINDAKDFWGIDSEIPAIGIIGGINPYKNILPYLDAVRNVKQCQLLICGNTPKSTIADIENVIAQVLPRTVLRLRTLSNREYMLAIVASDIIYCIYDKSFNGASGPLVDGVCAKKMVLSCSHGSLGEIVENNHIGITANCDDYCDMCQKTTEALQMVKDWKYDVVAEEFRKSLRPEAFTCRSKYIYEQFLLGEY